jgi:hypothetical protein
MSSKFKVVYIGLYFFLFCARHIPFIYAGMGIDASWGLSLLMTLDKKMEFGTEFIFNYGPLGFLNTGLLPMHFSPWWAFGFQSFFIANLVAVVFYGIEKFPKLKGGIALFGFGFLIPFSSFPDVTFLFLFIFFFWLLRFHAEPKSRWLWLASGALIFLFFVKLNLSYISLGVYVFTLVYFVFLFPAKRNVIFANLAGTLTTILILAKILNMNLAASYLASVKIIDAYQDSMAVVLTTHAEMVVYFGIVFSSLLAVLIFILMNRKIFNSNILLYCFLAIGWFLAYKQSFTAMARINVHGFISYLFPLVVLLVLFSHTLRKHHLLAIFVFIFCLKTFGLVYIRVLDAGFSAKEFVKSYYPQEKRNRINTWKSTLTVLPLNNPLNYFKKIFDYDISHNFEDSALNQKRVFPQKIRDKIGQKSIDIIPWEISYIYFNKFNYTARPIIQSYQANSEWLVEKNSEFFGSPRRPHFVLASLMPFREQNPFWTDRGVHLQLIKNYSLTDTICLDTDTLLLFKAKPNPSLQYIELVNRQAKLGKTIPVVDSNEILLFSAHVKYTFLGKLLRFLFQPTILKAELTLQNQEKIVVRIPPPVLAGGLMINYKITNNAELLRFHSRAYGSLKKIKSIRLFAADGFGIQETFDYKWTVVK